MHLAQRLPSIPVIEEFSALMKEYARRYHEEAEHLDIDNPGRE